MPAPSKLPNPCKEDSKEYKQPSLLHCHHSKFNFVIQIQMKPLKWPSHFRDVPTVVCGYHSDKMTTTTTPTDQY